MADLRVKMGSLELENPIIISSGHLTGTGGDVKRCDPYGAGAVITKSSLLEKEYEKIVKPHAPGLFPDARANFCATGDGLISIGGLSPLPVEAWAAWFKDNVKEIKTPVIAGLTALSVDGYIQGARMFEAAGAAALELQFGSPLPYLLSHPYAGGTSLSPAIVEEVCKAVRSEVGIPVGVKVMFSTIDPCLLQIPGQVGLDWLTIDTVFPAAPGINIDEIEPLMPSAVSLAGSKVAKYLNLKALLNRRDQCRNMHVSISGGTQTWSDLVEFIMYGASSVQVQTLFLQKGMGLIQKMKRSLAGYMDAKGFGTIAEMKGVILPKLLTYEEVIATYEKTKGKIVVSANEEKCLGCGLCEEVCNWGALKVDAIVEIAAEECEGCGLCVCSCPQKVLRLEHVEVMRGIARG